MQYQDFQFNTNTLHPVIWFQVFLLNTNNFQTGLFGLHMEPQQIQSLLVKVDLGVMVMKRYFVFPRALEQEPYY